MSKYDPPTEPPQQPPMTCCECRFWHRAPASPWGWCVRFADYFLYDESSEECE